MGCVASDHTPPPAQGRGEWKSGLSGWFDNFKGDGGQCAQGDASFVGLRFSFFRIHSSFHEDIDEQVSFLAGFHFVGIGMEQEVYALLDRRYLFDRDSLRRILQG